MRAGQGGSSVGRLSQAQTANVSVANTDAISRLGSIFMRAGGAYQLPVLGIDFQGSAGASEAPCCSSSMEMLSGERTKAMCPSRGGRRMVTPRSEEHTSELQSQSNIVCRLLLDNNSC